MTWFISIVAAVAVLVVVFRYGVHRATVLEYQKALRYTRGRFRDVLGPGQYWYVPFFTMIERVDVRPRFVSITGQEVLTADGVTLKVSLAANFEITDPDVAINKVQTYQDALYVELQLALRQIVGSAEIDALLSDRDGMSKRLMELAEAKAAALGLKLISVDLKDIMFPGRLKETFAQVVTARKEGLAALERARGETAALRHLANAARMMDSNPNLMPLRLLQAIEGSSGHTVVLGAPGMAGVPLSVTNRPDAAGETGAG